MDQKSIEKRAKKIQKNIDEAIKFFELESNVRNLVRQKIITNYMPSQQEIEGIVKSEVIRSAKSIDALSAAIKNSLREIVAERITNLAEEVKEEIKERIKLTIEEF